MRSILAKVINETISDRFPSLAIKFRSQHHMEYELIMDDHWRGYIGYRPEHIIFHSYNNTTNYFIQYSDPNVLERILDLIDRTIIQVQW